MQGESIWLDSEVQWVGDEVQLEVFEQLDVANSGHEVLGQMEVTDSQLDVFEQLESASSDQVLAEIEGSNSEVEVLEVYRSHQPKVFEHMEVSSSQLEVLELPRNLTGVQVQVTGETLYKLQCQCWSCVTATCTYLDREKTV